MKHCSYKFTCNHRNLLVLLDDRLSLLVSFDGELALAVVDKKSTWSADIDRFPELHVLQVL